MAEYTKTRTDADRYFAPNNHVKAFTWEGFDAGERDAGLAQAQREIVVFLGRDLCDPEDTDVYRDDYAVFEQALFLLENTPRTSAPGGTAKKTISREKKKEDEDKDGVDVSPMAVRYLAKNRKKAVRG